MSSGYDMLTTQEERLFMSSLMEKAQRDTIEEEDLTYTRDYFFFKNLVADRCINTPFNLKKIKGTDAEGNPLYTENIDNVDMEFKDNPEMARKLKSLAKHLHDFFRYASQKERIRLKVLEEHVIQEYFKDRFYITLSRIQGKIESMNKGRIRTYKSRINTCESVNIEYSLLNNKETDPQQNVFRGIKALIKINDASISLSTICSYVALISKFPDITDHLCGEVDSKIIKAAYWIKDIKLPKEQVEALDISYTTVNKGPDLKQKVVAVTCPNELMGFIADEVLMCLTSTFLGRNIAISEIVKVEQEQNKKQSAVDAGCTR